MNNYISSFSKETKTKSEESKFAAELSPIIYNYTDDNGGDNRMKSRHV